MRSLVLLASLAVMTLGCRNDGPTAGSPVGLIAYSGRVDLQRDIWLIGSDGSGRVNLTNDTIYDGEPSWAPGGHSIAFVRIDPSLGPDIYPMRPDGSNIDRITNTPGDWERSPAWSPDGRRIAYNVFESSGFDRVYVMNSNGSGQRELGRGGPPQWAPDGVHIAYSGPAHGSWSGIILLNVDTGEESVITPYDTTVYGDPAWSPDGDRIAYAHRRLTPNSHHRLMTMNASGSDPVVVLEAAGILRTPAWSPDGSQLAFMSTMNASEQIYTIQADGTGLRQLTFGDSEMPALTGSSTPVWQPVPPP